jgi:hypothetical protein
MVTSDKRIACVAALAGLLVVPLVLLVTGEESPGPSDDLWAAIVQVESGGNAGAYNRRGGAAGIAQIRAVAVKDLNRIARLRGLEARYALADRYDSAKSREMWRLYLAFYGARYTKQTGEAPTDEVYARIWNGGPSGWAKNATQGYWDRVQTAFE